jgi:hypothetical protein
MVLRELLSRFEDMSPFQHAAVAVLTPLVGFVLLFVLLGSSVIPPAYVAIASFVSFGLVIPSAVIYVLAIYLREEG